MFMLYGLLVGLVIGRITGGRIERLANVRLDWIGLAIGGLIVQLLLFSDPVTAVVGTLGPLLYVASTALVLIVVVRNIRILAGLAVVAVGAACNLAAIIANGGYMPVTPGALSAAEHVVKSGYSNSVLDPRPALEFLVDRFALPPWVPFSNVFSIGDIIISIGIAAVVVSAMRRSGPVAAPGSHERSGGTIAAMGSPGEAPTL